jgi:uncharacterized protein YkwD
MSRIGSRLTFLLCTAAGALVLLASPALGSGTRQSASLDAGILLQLNHIRVVHGLAPLEVNARLSAAAAQHTLEMVTKGYFAHDSLGGTPFSKRLEGYYPAQGFNYWSVGENLFWSSGPVGAAAGVEAWMRSPEHRANILSPTWHEIGIGAVSVPTAPGVFNGLGVTVITTDFGVRR